MQKQTGQSRLTVPVRDTVRTSHDSLISSTTHTPGRNASAFFWIRDSWMTMT